MVRVPASQVGICIIYMCIMSYVLLHGLGNSQFGSHFVVTWFSLGSCSSVTFLSPSAGHSMHLGLFSTGRVWGFGFCLFVFVLVGGFFCTFRTEIACFTPKPRPAWHTCTGTAPWSRSVSVTCWHASWGRELCRTDPTPGMGQAQPSTRGPVNREQIWNR